MALQINCPSSFTLTTKPYRRLLLSHKPLSHFTVKSQASPEPPKSTVKLTDSEAPAQSNNKPTGSSTTGVGFGSSASASSPAKESASNKKKRKGKRERASIIRRNPVANPAFASASTTAEDEEKARERGRNESAFLLAWLGLGGIILVQGIALAASGFLPEEWDKFFVKYLYPSFTPTVVLFVAGTVAYGVLKYLQNENLKDQK